MSFTHKITEKVLTAGREVAEENSFSGDGQVSLSVSVPDSTTDQLVDLALNVSEIKAVYIVSDQDLTLETNDGSTPDDTLSLVAGVPYVWHENSYYSNLLITDITALYLTNASGATATLELEAVYDSTP